MSRKTKPKAGRPAGSANAHRKVVHAVPPRCPACGSTNHEPYGAPYQEMEHGGEAPDGKAYTHVVWRRTKCRDCNQQLSVALYENRGLKPPSARKKKPPSAESTESSAADPPVSPAEVPKG